MMRHLVFSLLLAFLSTVVLSGAAALPSNAYAKESTHKRHHHVPFVGNGTCDAPVQNADGSTSVRCLGPPHPLKPGETIDVVMLLDNPYPVDRNVTVTNMTAQMVAPSGDSWRPVPLDELYVHHYVADGRFLLGEGAELRGSYKRKQLSYPNALIIDGHFTSNASARGTNIQLIDTVGVAPEDMQECIECWCPPEEAGAPATRGSLICCKQCPTNVTMEAINYHLETNFTYREVLKEEKGANFIGFDVTGGKIEYNILGPNVEATGEGPIHQEIHRTVLDGKCPQKDPFYVLRCTAHQHIGSQCITMYNEDNGDVICKSCPVFGKEPGQPGNELGYVVQELDDEVNPPYKVQPGTHVSIVSQYDASQKRLGAMGLFTLWVSDLGYSCGGQFGMGMMAGQASVDGDKAVGKVA